MFFFCSPGALRDKEPALAFSQTIDKANRSLAHYLQWEVALAAESTHGKRDPRRSLSGSTRHCFTGLIPVDCP
ncbi:hypothetical protein MPNT_50068 [Candidatus Methylacidithermus pantelleriae]|uniref:Uncharacterized protein n=1 Tax=Candidatus Methylacidithermus pantelleriae TaxID=2744239 RepID=A0A8J2FTG8_9BACT|nr:hypothetical protein MPNT_50068 [Candidatus Methylacidithermus pantelleriae]